MQTEIQHTIRGQLDRIDGTRYAKSAGSGLVYSRPYPGPMTDREQTSGAVSQRVTDTDRFGRRQDPFTPTRRERT